MLASSCELWQYPQRQLCRPTRSTTYNSATEECPLWRCFRLQDNLYLRSRVIFFGVNSRNILHGTGYFPTITSSSSIKSPLLPFPTPTILLAPTLFSVSSYHLHRDKAREHLDFFNFCSEFIEFGCILDYFLTCTDSLGEGGWSRDPSKCAHVLGIAKYSDSSLVYFIRFFDVMFMLWFPMLDLSRRSQLFVQPQYILLYCVTAVILVEDPLSHLVQPKCIPLLPTAFCLITKF